MKKFSRIKITENDITTYILKLEVRDSVYRTQISFNGTQMTKNRTNVANTLRRLKYDLYRDALNHKYLIGQIWQHHGNKHLYKVTDVSSNLKLNGEWLNQGSVTYMDLATGIKYSRTVKDFEESFTRIN